MGMFDSVILSAQNAVPLVLAGRISAGHNMAECCDILYRIKHQSPHEIPMYLQPIGHGESVQHEDGNHYFDRKYIWTKEGLKR